MIPTIEKMKFTDVLHEAITWSGLSVSQFCLQSGFAPDRVYKAQNGEDGKLSLDTLEQIITRFPELNGDRFIRRSGPVLLSEFCEPVKDYDAIIQSLNETLKHSQDMNEMKDKQISLLESQLELYRDILSKRP